MRKYGLIGYPLEHSFSKKYFTEKFNKQAITDCRYENYPIDSIDKLYDIVTANPELIGLNVTIPYKQVVISYLHEVDDEASEIGAVNTIRIYRTNNHNAVLKGFNTDKYGFIQPLKEVIGSIHKNALILGTGGASKAVAYALNELSVSFRYVSRKPKYNNILSYNDLNEQLINDCKIIINTSPVGMYPDVDSLPAIPYSAITKDHILYDLVYNPEKTLFLQKGEARNATILNGLPMLHLQAEKAWEIWNS